MEIVNSEWYQDVDCSAYLAQIIDTFNKKGEVSTLWDVKKRIINKIKKKMK